MKMFPEFIEIKLCFDRHTVVDDVKITIGKVDDPLTAAVSDVGFPNILLWRNLPVIDRRSGRYGSYVQLCHIR
jgi:hypothetical protein